jgi:hypothetical protein
MFDDGMYMILYHFVPIRISLLHNIRHCIGYGSFLHFHSSSYSAEATAGLGLPDRSDLIWDGNEAGPIRLCTEDLIVGG